MTDSDHDRRSSDDNMILLQQKLDDHIADYHANRECENQRWSHLIAAQEINTKAITDLTESTRDLIRAWQSINGTVRVASAVGNFFKWLSGFAVVGVIVKFCIDNF